MLGEAATGAGALGVALTAHALVGEPHGVWKVHSSAKELGMLCFFFVAYAAVCYDAATMSEPFIGALVILLIGGVLPASVQFVEDETRPMLNAHTQASWTMSNLARVGLVASTVATLAVEVLWFEAKNGTTHLAGVVAGASLAGFAIVLAIYGMPAGTPAPPQQNAPVAKAQSATKRNYQASSVLF
jgi:hypothetical protein